MTQGDLFVDAEDAVIVKDSRHLQTIINALPAKPLLRAWDITNATGMSAQTIGNLRDAGAFTGFNLGSREKPRYRYHRTSFLLWLKSRMIKGEY